MMTANDNVPKLPERPTHREAIMVACPSCGHSGMSDVYDEIGRLHATSIFILLSIFTGEEYLFRKDRLPYGFERNHYCRHCGCYIGTSGKVKSIL
ncbi:unnamed protein product [Hermetia illucens]|uniref:LITAF domain-containing protein n=1 Tax=Hermetia illucens TaxID=343691 RepID=A0A7R8U9P7_HERIL|nr:unnamed protein product [Hermetia illucens]